MAMSDGRIYVLGGAPDDATRAAAIAEMRAWFQTQDAALLEEFDSQVDDRDIRLLTCIDAASGETLWKHGVDLTNCGGRFLRGGGFGARRGYDPHLGGGMYVHNGVVVFGSEGGADKGWSVFYTGRYEVRAHRLQRRKRLAPVVQVRQLPFASGDSGRYGSRRAVGLRPAHR